MGYCMGDFESISSGILPCYEFFLCIQEVKRDIVFGQDPVCLYNWHDF